jgi:hypothetical protein
LKNSNGFRNLERPLDESLSYSKNNSFQTPYSVDLKNSQGIRPYPGDTSQAYSPDLQNQYTISPIKEMESEESKMQIVDDEDIERLRKENEVLRQNLSNLIENK